jgi:hypothetical protein
MSPLVAGTDAAKSWHDAERRVALGCIRLCELRRSCPASEEAGVDGVGPEISIRASPIRYGQPSRPLPVSGIATVAS